MKGKIHGVIRKCKMCKKSFQPLSHNHIYYGECQKKHKLESYRKYNKTRTLIPVTYKFTHKKKNDGLITKEQIKNRLK